MADEKESKGCGCLFYSIVILVILGLIIGIPIHRSIQEEREREAQLEYERSLPKAPDFAYTKEDISALVQKNMFLKTIEYSGIANIVTTSFTIHNAECTNIRQFGIRNDKVDATLKAYSYYIDGTLTFTCIDKYEYNFNTQEWEYTAGSWAPTNVKLKR